MTRKLVEEIRKAAIENRSDVWKTVAKGLSRPRRKGHEVNLFKIEKFAKPKETIVVPGKVLGVGKINKPVIVAAMKFSDKAKESVEKAGGRCLSIKELVEENPKGDKVRMMR